MKGEIKANTFLEKKANETDIMPATFSMNVLQVMQFSRYSILTSPPESLDALNCTHNLENLVFVVKIKALRPLIIFSLKESGSTYGYLTTVYLLSL